MEYHQQTEASASSWQFNCSWTPRSMCYSGAALLRKARTIADIQSRNQPGTMELLQLDVANDESISAAAKMVESK